MIEAEYKNILKRIFVDNGEYQFESNNKAQRFINKVLSEARLQYEEEHYYHKYNDFKDFLYASEVDGIAYFVFEGEYGEY